MIGTLMKEAPKPRSMGLGLAIRRLVLFPGCLLIFLAYMLGIRPNVSDSLPIGLYIPAKTGPLVTICPAGPVARLADTRGYRSWGLSCPDRREALLKAIAGYPGDLVTVTNQGVSINGRWWPRSKPLPVDSKGRPLPFLRKTLRVRIGMVWVMGTHQESFDSRYFGEIPTEWIADRMRALWVWR